MHIAFVTPGWPPESCPNGIATYTAHMRSELLRQGHRVSLVSLDPAAHDPAAGVHGVTASRWHQLLGRLAPRERLPAPFGHGDVIAETLLRLHRADPLDLVEMEESFGWCAQVQRRLPVPVVAKLHGPAWLSLVDEERESAQAKLKMQIEGEALRAMRCVTSPSAITLEQTWAHYRLPRGEQHVVPNPIVAPAELPLWRAEAADCKRLLFVGRFDKRKGADFLLHAFAQLHDRDPALRLSFVGPDVGIVGEAGRREGIGEYLAGRFTPAQREAVQVLGRLPPAQIARLRCEAALTLVCSRWDNQPNTALEAMLQGCPLLATDAGSLREVVAHERTGLLYRQDDVEDFCRQAQRLLADRRRATALGAAAREHVRAVHSPRAVVDRTLALYRRFAGVREAPARVRTEDPAR